jgi:hypothetical protein
MSFEYSTKELVKLAYAAYRVNDGYIKEKESGKQPNRELITYTASAILNQENQNSVQKLWVPTDFVPLTVTDADLDGAAEAENFFKKYTFLSIGNDLNQFQKDVYQSYLKETTSVVSCGRIAFIPVLVKNELQFKVYSRRIKTDFSESKHIFSKSVEGTAEILRSFRLKDYAVYLHIAGVNGNLVSFSNAEKFPTGAYYHLRGKVKSHETERDTQLPLTKLNYVKLSLIEEK